MSLALSPLAETLGRLSHAQRRALRDELGLGEWYLEQLAAGDRRNPAGWLKRRIAEVLGRPVEELFPEA